MLGVLYGDETLFRRMGAPNYKYIMLAYTLNGSEFNKYPISLKHQFITDLTFRPSNDGHLVFCGFYSDKGTYSIKGTYFFKINPQTKEISNQNLKKLDFDFRTEYTSNRKKEKLEKEENSGDTKKAPELYQFALDELILRNDGGALLVAEQFYIEEQRYYDYNYYSRSGRYRYTYIYHYNDIIIVNIGPNGEIEWASRIPKRQETVNDGGRFSSYAMSIVRDKIYFVYNENGKNFDSTNKPKRGRHNFNGKYSLIAVSEVGQDGSIATYPLYQNQDANVLTRPKICKQIGRKEMAIYGERNRDYRFGKLTF